MRIKKILRAIGSAEAVYELRKTPFFVTIIAALFFGILHMTPFTIRFFAVGTYRFDLSMWQLDEQAQTELIQGLPEGCYIANGRFHCQVIDHFAVGENVWVYINEPSEQLYQGLVFMNEYVIFVASQQSYVLPYASLEGFDFGYLQSLDNGYDLLFNRMADGLRGIMIVPFVLGTYQTAIFSYLVYIFVISALAMLLKFGHTMFITFKEMLNIMIFASLLPIAVVIPIGFFVPALTAMLFYMGVPLWAYVVYKKYVMPGLYNTNLKESESP
ncbi:MAG: DUF1189 domain-containing protein [Turicibacter sp.]|nr:DUF1189 domain-containing protein [Turicibacter sp.]